jgi:hypothetical protein
MIQRQGQIASPSNPTNRWSAKNLSIVELNLSNSEDESYSVKYVSLIEEENKATSQSRIKADLFILLHFHFRMRFLHQYPQGSGFVFTDLFY